LISSINGGKSHNSSCTKKISVYSYFEVSEKYIAKHCYMSFMPNITSLVKFPYKEGLDDTEHKTLIKYFNKRNHTHLIPH